MPLTAPTPTMPALRISESDPLLQIEKSENGVTFLIEGSATTLEAESLREVVRACLAKANVAKNVVFDMSKAIPIFNIAGRVFDMALEAASQRTASSLATVLRMPRDFYDDLRWTDDLPEPAHRFQHNGLTIELLDNSPLLTFAAEEATPPALPILASYTGKIRALKSHTVFVSLFSVEGDIPEIVGELDRRQFPEEDLWVGQIFTYDIISSDTGVSQLKIACVPKLTMHHDDLLELYQKARGSLPPEVHTPDPMTGATQ
jgi:hypothetical protein